MNKNKDKCESNIISLGVLVFLLVAQMDYYNEQYLQFILWVLAYNINIFESNKKIKKQFNQPNYKEVLENEQ